MVWIEHPIPAAKASAPAVEARPPARRVARPGDEPHHFWHLSMGEVTERREWLKVDRRTWEERYPGGAVMRYRITGRLDEGGRTGTLAVSLPDARFEVFIPDKGAVAWPARRVLPGGEWSDLGPMHLIE